MVFCIDIDTAVSHFLFLVGVFSLMVFVSDFLFMLFFLRFTVAMF